MHMVFSYLYDHPHDVAFKPELKPAYSQELQSPELTSYLLDPLLYQT